MGARHDHFGEGARGQGFVLLVMDAEPAAHVVTDHAHVGQRQAQRRAVKRLLKTLNVDDEKFKPREMCWFFNSCKDQGLRAGAADYIDAYLLRHPEYQASADFKAIAECSRVLERRQVNELLGLCAFRFKS